MSVDFFINGEAQGSVAGALALNGMDPDRFRPWVDPNSGRSYIDVTTLDGGGKPVTHAQPITTNAPATLRKDEWIQLDRAIVESAKPRMRAVGDLRGGGQVYTIPNGMAKTILETERVGDITPAEVSMDPVTESESDRLNYDLVGLPLPVIHKGFRLNLRQVAASRNVGAPIDTSMAALAGRRVGEEAEKMLLGISSTADQFKYGGYTVYGYTDFPSRNTKTLTAPTATSWTGATLISEVLQMRTQSQNDFHYGPWFCYVGTDWDEYLDADYSAAKGSNTLRDRIAQIDGIDRPVTLDYLPAKTFMLVQKTSDVARMVVGMDIVTIQWESHGGMVLNFKVMAIIVPQLRADFNGNCGIVHGSYS